MSHDFDALIAQAYAKYQVQPEILRPQIQHESGWDALAIGDGGLALGLMQVHRIAAEDVGMANEWDALSMAIAAKDRMKAAELSIFIGAAYLAKCLKEFQGSIAWALAAYNQGPGVIGRAKRYAESVMALRGIA